MNPTKTAWDGSKFVKISDEQMPEFIAACRGRQDQRAKVNARIMSVQYWVFFFTPAFVLFLWCVAHWFGASERSIAFGQDYTFCVLPICAMFLYIAKGWYDARPYRQI
jgi:hypothetical protein